VIVWLNGTFGVGKTTTGGHLSGGDDRLRHFDPEWVGYMLANNLPDHAVTDFQQYPSWRRLVPVVAHEISQFTGQHLVAAQSVLVEDYWREIVEGLAGLNHEVFHVLLDADAETLHARIDSDDREPARIRPWRHRHVDVFQSALNWLRPAADLVVDTVTFDALAASQQIRSAIDARL
jgi:RNase adaptor protein for sRNA GlmZ degradation